MGSGANLAMAPDSAAGLLSCADFGAQAETRKCSGCSKQKPISDYIGRARLTCLSCITTKRQQHRDRQIRKSNQRERVQMQTKSMETIVAGQAAEIDRLQRALAVLEAPEASLFEGKFLIRLNAEPCDTEAIDWLLARPVQHQEATQLQEHSATQCEPCSFSHEAKRQKHSTTKSIGSWHALELLSSMLEHPVGNSATVTRDRRLLDLPIDVDLIDVPFLETETWSSERICVKAEVDQAISSSDECKIRSLETEIIRSDLDTIKKPFPETGDRLAVPCFGRKAGSRNSEHVDTGRLVDATSANSSFGVSSAANFSRRPLPASSSC